MYKKIPKMCLDVPCATELAEPVVYLDLLVPTNCFAHPCGDHAPVFRELRPIKPLDELAKFGNNRNDPVIWSCIEKLAKCSEHEFIINCRFPRIPPLR